MATPSQLPEPQSPPSGRAGSALGRFMARGGRDHLWAFLDFLDARPALRRTLLVGAPVLAVAAGLGAWGYRHWAQTNSIRIARQWLAAGRLDRAEIAVHDAITTEPDLPASWSLASELAWRKGNRAASVEYAKKAASAGHFQAGDVLAWAEAALLAEDDAQTQEAVAYLDPAAARASPRALRLAGEVARRAHRFEEARDNFQAALAQDAGTGTPMLAVDEVPLGIASLQTGSAADRVRGQGLLAKWAPDPQWGVDAMRALLADAVAHGDRDATVGWAEALRSHPRLTLADLPLCLKALADVDPPRFMAMLAPLEEKGRTSPTEAAQLMGWLSQIGQGDEAVRWSGTLDFALARNPPVAPAVAEALRATGRWEQLDAWVGQGDWGRDVGFLGWAYGMAAARRLGEGPRADALWASLYADGRASPAHALYVGDLLYAWGYPKEAAALLWAAADRPDLAYQALGTLARLYQVQRDAVGQYRAFSRLSALRSADRSIANNYAYFAALTDLGSQTHVERIAEDNFTHDPSNVAFRCTYAFVLTWSGQASKAMGVLEPVARQWKTSPAVAFAYGAALAGVGRKPEAREVFDSLDPRGLDPQEADWIRAALR